MYTYLCRQWKTKCELEVKASDLVKRLEKEAKSISEYRNTMGRTARESIEAQALDVKKVLFIF